MAIPDRRAAAALLATFNPPDWHVRHVSGVAEVAAFLAARMAGRGISVDRGLVEAAALLHDLDRLLPDDDPLQALGHGEAGGRWLLQHGHGELARAVAAHSVTRLTDEDRYHRWAAGATREERIVAYADKRCGQQLEPMASRFAEWGRRYPDFAPGLAVARPRANRLEREVCDAAGVRPDEIRRLRWVADAWPPRTEQVA